MHSPPALSVRHRENQGEAGELKALMAQILFSAIIENMEQRTAMNNSAGRRPVYKTIFNKYFSV